jgi:hypothetical protein
MADEEKDQALEAANALSEIINEGKSVEIVPEEKPDEKDGKAAEVKTEIKAEDKPAENKTEEKQVDDSLLERAVRAGIPLNRARAFKSADDLETTVSAIETAKPAEKSDVKPAEKPAEEFKVENFDDLKDEGFDPRLIERLNKMAATQKSLADENKALREESKAFGEKLGRQGSDRVEQEFNARFDKLGDDFSKDFGKGEWSKLDQNGVETKQRAAVVAEMAAMVTGYQSMKRAIPDQETLFKRAVFNVTGRIPSEAAKQDDIPDRLKAQAAKTVGKPAGTAKANTATGELNQALRELDEALGH